MTRKQEIKLNARWRADQYDHPTKWSDTYYGFISGAEWADRTMIDKACSWLLEWETHQREDIEVVEQFRKAMEGGEK